jgi:hypothetical protein
MLIIQLSENPIQVVIIKKIRKRAQSELDKFKYLTEKNNMK